jgi:hypothetical protein
VLIVLHQDEATGRQDAISTGFPRGHPRVPGRSCPGADAFMIVVATITIYGDHLHNDHERIQARTLVAGCGCEVAALLGAADSHS